MTGNFLLTMLGHVPVLLKEAPPSSAHDTESAESRVGKRVVAVKSINSLLQIDFTKSDQRMLSLRNYEPEVKRYMYETVYSGNVVVDVGAHIGLLHTTSSKFSWSRWTCDRGRAVSR